MRKTPLFFLFLLLIFAHVTALPLIAQTGVQVTTFNTVTTARQLNLTSTGILFNRITWSVISGAPASCQVQVDSSADGVSWNSGDVVSTKTCTTNGTATSASGAFNFVRVNVTALSASSTITVVWNGFTTNPAGGGSITLNPPGVNNDVVGVTGANQIGALDTGLFTYSSSTLGAPNVAVPGVACLGPGATTDGTTVLNKIAKLSASNLILAATSDTALTFPVIQTADNTICTALAANHGMFSHWGDLTTLTMEAAGGSTAGHSAVPSATTAATAHDINFPSTAWYGTILGKFATTTAANGTATVLYAPYVPQDHTFTFTIDGNGSAIVTGALGTFPTALYPGTINRIDISADQSCSITVDIWKKAGAIPSAADKISASAPATLSAAQLSQNGSLSGWTTAVATGDVFSGTIASVSGCQRVTIQGHYQ